MEFLLLIHTTNISLPVRNIIFNCALVSSKCAVDYGKAYGGIQKFVIAQLEDYYTHLRIISRSSKHIFRKENDNYSY